MKKLTNKSREQLKEINKKKILIVKRLLVLNSEIQKLTRYY